MRKNPYSFATVDVGPGQSKQISRPISVRVFYHAISDWLKKTLLHPNFQRLTKLCTFKGVIEGVKVAFLIRATFLLKSSIQKMPNYFRRPIQSKSSSQPAPATKAETAPSDGRIGKPSTYFSLVTLQICPV